MRSISKAILVGALLALTAPAFAEEAHHTGSEPTASQPPSPSGAQPGTGMMSGNMMSGGMMSMKGNMDGMMAPRYVEGRIAFLKTELKITADQEPLWQAFAEAIRNESRTMADMSKQMPGMMAPSSLPERLERHESMLHAHLDHLRQIRTALQPLYQALDEDQRRTADELIMPMAMGMM
jgi:hypothetical protein